MSGSRAEAGRRAAAELYQHWERAMGTWWDEVLASPAVLSTMGRGLSAQSTARQQYERAVEEQLARLHLPTRGDLVRMTRIATLLEEKLLQQEDTLLALREELAEARRDALAARVESAEARVELRSSLAALQQALGAHAPAPLEAPGAVPSGPAEARSTRSRARRTAP
jgi:hypothetical protein